MSEGSQEDVYAAPYIDPSEHTINMGGTDYHLVVTETDRVSTYTGLDDYDTLFAWALDSIPNVGEQKSATTSEIPIPIAGPELINPMERMVPIHSDQKETVKLQLTSSSSEIIGEGAAVFTDMTETI